MRRLTGSSIPEYVFACNRGAGMALTTETTVIVQCEQQTTTVGRRLAAIIRRLLLAQEDIEHAMMLTIHCGRVEEDVKLDVMKRY